MAQIAQDTFNADLKDGSQLLVTKGSVWPDSHEVVALDAGREFLFKPVAESFGEPKAAAKVTAKATAKGGT